MFKGLEGDLQTNTNQAQTISNSGGYQTAQNLGADYSIGGKFLDLFTGANKNAENIANAYNTALSEQKARDYASYEAKIARDFNAAEAATARNFSAQEAEKARNWEKMMQDTKYQRMMEDAEKAGINPLYLIGATSSTPNAATAQTTAATAESAKTGYANPPTTRRSDNASLEKMLSTVAMTAIALSRMASPAKGGTKILQFIRH